MKICKIARQLNAVVCGIVVLNLPAGMARQSHVGVLFHPTILNRYFLRVPAVVCVEKGEIGFSGGGPTEIACRSGPAIFPGLNDPDPAIRICCPDIVEDFHGAIQTAIINQNELRRLQCLHGH